MGANEARVRKTDFLHELTRCRRAPFLFTRRISATYNFAFTTRRSRYLFLISFARDPILLRECRAAVAAVIWTL